MSDFRLYQSTLNVDEIGSIYNGGVGTQSEFTDEDFIPGYFGSCLRFHRNSVIPIGNPTNLQFGSQHDFTFSLWVSLCTLQFKNIPINVPRTKYL